MRLRRSTLINLVGQGLGLIISLATVPRLLHLIGDARYGVLLLVWLLLGYFSLFDLGVSQATAQRMATLRDAEPAARSRLLWTALAMNGAMGVIASVVLYGVGWVVLGQYVDMDPMLRAESLRALPWISLALLVNLIAAAFTGALGGREAFGSVTLGNTLGLLLSQCLPLAVAGLWSPSLALLIPAAVLARAVSAVVLGWRAWHLVPVVTRPACDRLLGRELLGYGGWVTVSAVVGPLMSSMDRMVIAGISGAQAVTYYGVPQSLALRLLMLPSALSGALFPRFAAEGQQRRDALADAAVRALAGLMTPAVLVGLFLAKPFLSLWISPAFAAKAGAVAEIVMLGVWTNGLALVAHASLQARGRPDLVARLHLCELPAYLGVLAGSLYLWGVVGAAIAWTARVTVDAVMLFVMSGYARTVGRRLLVPIAALAGAVLVLRLGDHMPAARWGGAAALLLVTGAWALRVFPWKLLHAPREQSAAPASGEPQGS